MKKRITIPILAILLTGTIYGQTIEIDVVSSAGFAYDLPTGGGNTISYWSYTVGEPATATIENVGAPFDHVELGFEHFHPLITVAVSVPEVSSLGVYPNPTARNLYFEDLDLQSYRITDMGGRLVQSGIITNGSIDIESLSPGSYILIGYTENQNNQTLIIKS